MKDKIYTFQKSHELFKRAVDVVPGGIYGSKAPGFTVPGSYPYFFTHGKGAHIFDVDGNEYIDFLCGFGTNILGYGYSPVNKKVAERMNQGEVFNSATEEFVELSELLVDTVTGMDWALIGKNGTDMTTFGVTLARIHTNKKKVLMAKGAYHGTAPWAAPSDHFILDDKKDIVKFEYNNLEQIKSLFAQYKGEIAGIILTPYHHPAFGDSYMPVPEFYPTIEKLLKEEGALMIMDDIRCNFRLDINGSHNYFGTQPDIITMGKSLGNGHPVSVVLGKKELYKSATGVYATGTFWFQAGALVAAIETVKEYKRLNSINHMMELGNLFRDGLAESAKEQGLKVNLTGAPTIPFMSFTGDPDLYYNQVFCAEATKRGVYLHPHHNWFIAYAHSKSDIERALEVCRVAFDLTRQQMEQDGWSQ